MRWGLRYRVSQLAELLPNMWQEEIWKRGLRGSEWFCQLTCEKGVYVVCTRERERGGGGGGGKLTHRVAQNSECISWHDCVKARVRYLRFAFFSGDRFPLLLHIEGLSIIFEFQRDTSNIKRSPRKTLNFSSICESAVPFTLEWWVTMI